VFSAKKKLAPRLKRTESNRSTLRKAA
jgi:hypothetical protein